MLTDRPSKSSLLLKAQNGHLHYVAKNEPEKLSFLLQNYLGINRDRWMHWL